MGVRGKRRSDRIITTYSDCGQLGNRSVFSRHFSEKAAANAWKKYCRWYGINSRSALYMAYRLWQVDHRTNETINDTGIYGHKAFGRAPA